MKRLQVLIDGQKVGFRQTPYGKVVVGCSCQILCCDHRFKALPEWLRFIRGEG